nr:uncharacterized protein LOC108174837 isoform X1 [Malus domestica]XP_028946459.1 uncharacterized protein LOC108174837 isoform X1 [Malus domestica]
MTFLRKNSLTSGIVLEDFDNVFTNKFYHSHLDEFGVFIFQLFFQIRTQKPCLAIKSTSFFCRREEEHKRKWPVLRTQGKTSSKRLKTLKSRRRFSPRASYPRDHTMVTSMSATAHWLLLH